MSECTSTGWNLGACGYKLKSRPDVMASCTLARATVPNNCTTAELDSLKTNINTPPTFLPNCWRQVFLVGAQQSLAVILNKVRIFELLHELIAEPVHHVLRCQRITQGFCNTCNLSFFPRKIRKIDRKSLDVRITIAIMRIIVYFAQCVVILPSYR